MIQFLTQTEINEFLGRQYIGRLACCKDNIPYLIPITYCYDSVDDSVIGYTGFGKKLHMLRKNPKVCLEVDEIEGLATWRTVIGMGEFIELRGTDARKALQFFVKTIRMLAQKNEQDKHVQFLKDMANTEIHFSESVIYKIKFYEKTGRCEHKG